MACVEKPGMIMLLVYGSLGLYRPDRQDVVKRLDVGAWLMSVCRERSPSQAKRPAGPTVPLPPPALICTGGHTTIPHGAARVCWISHLLYSRTTGHNLQNSPVVPSATRAWSRSKCGSLASSTVAPLLTPRRGHAGEAL